MARTTRGKIKIVGTSGQISLGKRYAGRTFELERLDDGTLLLRPVALVPENQIWRVEDMPRSEVSEGPTSSTTGATSTPSDTEPGSSDRHTATLDWVAEWLRHRIPPASGPTAREILDRGRGRLATASPRSMRKGANPSRTARPRGRRGGGADR
jgi:hypothetical protein